MNSWSEEVRFQLPPASFGQAWTVVLDTADPDLADADEVEFKESSTISLTAQSLRVLRRPQR
ncbi:hypothetical protein [Streptomyces sp. NPDC101178]|uniref:hypothetical protein n=1 Tax=Streptomyces sp. NPDC101178 TaxID=3366124 RepID=UPI00382EAA99